MSEKGPTDDAVKGNERERGKERKRRRKTTPALCGAALPEAVVVAKDYQHRELR